MCPATNCRQVLCPAIARPATASCCIRMPAVRALSSKIFWTSAGLVAAAGVDAVEPLGVPAGVVVELQLSLPADLELVGDRADLDAS